MWLVSSSWEGEGCGQAWGCEAISPSCNAEEAAVATTNFALNCSNLFLRFPPGAPLGIPVRQIGTVLRRGPVFMRLRLCGIQWSAVVQVQNWPLLKLAFQPSGLSGSSLGRGTLGESCVCRWMHWRRKVPCSLLSDCTQGVSFVGKDRQT